MCHVDEIIILLVQDTRWAQDVVPVNFRLFLRWGQYRGVLPSLKMFYPCKYHKAVEIRHEVPTSNIALEACLGQAKPREREGKVAHEPADVTFAWASSAFNKIGRFCKLQPACNVSVQNFAVAGKNVKAQLVQVTTERLELTTNLDAVAANYFEGVVCCVRCS